MASCSAVCATGYSADEPHTILVVEDEILLRLPLADFLRDAGFRVFEAADVTQGVAVLTADTPVDLVFTDVNLAGPEDGFALLGWLRRHQPHIGVLITSGRRDAARRAAENATLFVAKPYELGNVLEMIQSLLRSARKRRSGRAAPL